MPEFRLRGDEFGHRIQGVLHPAGAALRDLLGQAVQPPNNWPTFWVLSTPPRKSWPTGPPNLLMSQASQRTSNSPRHPTRAHEGDGIARPSP